MEVGHHAFENVLPGVNGKIRERWVEYVYVGKNRRVPCTDTALIHQ